MGPIRGSYANAVARALAEPLVVTVVGAADDVLATALWRRARASVDPCRSLHRLEPGRDDEMLGRLEFPADRVAAYVCIGTVCSAPIADEASLGRALDEASGRYTHPD